MASKLLIWRGLRAWRLLLAAMLAPAAHAHPIASVTPAVCVARVMPGDAATAMLSTPARFDCKTTQTAFGSGDYWVLSAPFSWPAGQWARIRTVSMWQHAVTLYGLYGDGQIIARRTSSATMARHLVLGAYVERTLPARPAPLVRLLWRVDGSANLRGILAGARVIDLAHAGERDLMMGGIYAAFAGLCVALIVYNLALWGALRHRFQLTYCAMVAALLVYALSSSGVLGWICPWLDNNDRMRINYLMLGTAAATSVLFARSFFEERVFAGRLRVASSIVVAALLGSTGLFFLFASFATRLLDRVVDVAYLSLVLLVPWMLWRAWQRRSNYLWLFAIAWAAPILFASLRLANAVGLVAWSFWLDNSTILSMTCEALLSSLAIAYRIRLLSLERDEARAQELAARMLADQDPLTGLLNRRAFLTRAIGGAEPCQLIILDLDRFKQVNETIGHDGGDEVLRLAARAIRDAMPPAALVSRFGGEEFAIAVPEAVGFVPETLLQALRAQRMPFDLEVTGSIGCCTGPLATEADWKALYRAADRALFEAKERGRDRARRGTMPPRYAAAA